VTDTNVFQLVQPGTLTDRLTEVLRDGARALLAQAVQTEVTDFLAAHVDKRTDDGRQRLVRHGHLPERSIMTGIGPVEVRVPRVRDRLGGAEKRIRFNSAILPPYARRSKSLEVLIPVLYLKGNSTGDFAEALAALLGQNAGGLSASTIARLKEVWADEHARWLKRDLSAKHYVYFWVDGIYVQARLEDQAQCLLVIIGATPEGKKELVGLADGLRESAQSWGDLLFDLKRRGLSSGPQLAVGDGARSASGRRSRRCGRPRGTGNTCERQTQSRAHLHRPPSDDPIERLPLQQDRTRHDLQARASRREELASPQRLQPLAESHPRSKFNDGIEVVRSQTQTAAA
jgi:putative transposase